MRVPYWSHGTTWLGMADIIEKIIDSRYIGIFKTFWQVIVIEKIDSGIIEGLYISHFLIISQIVIMDLTLP